MKIYKFIALTWLLLLLNLAAYSQQLPLFSQYVLNAFLLNPAIAGSDGFTTVNLTSRLQWLGYDNGPQTYSCSAQMRLLKRNTQVSKRKLFGARSGRVGLGANVLSDHNGALTTTQAAFTYAYHIHFQTNQLSFGITGKFTQVSIDKNKLSFDDPSDPVLKSLNGSIYYPDAAVGIFYSGPKGFIGTSVDQLFQSGLRFTNSDVSYVMHRQYYVLGGFNFPVGDVYDLEPSFLIKTNEQFTTQVDVGMRAFMEKLYWFGFTFRTNSLGTNNPSNIFSNNNATYIFSIGLRYRQFIIGYSFDYSTNPLSQATYGSHELVIAAKFGDNARRYRYLDRY